MDGIAATIFGIIIFQNPNGTKRIGQLENKRNATERYDRAEYVIVEPSTATRAQKIMH